MGSLVDLRGEHRRAATGGDASSSRAPTFSEKYIVTTPAQFILTVGEGLKRLQVALQDSDAQKDIVRLRLHYQLANILRGFDGMILEGNSFAMICVKLESAVTTRDTDAATKLENAILTWDLEELAACSCEAQRLGDAKLHAFAATVRSRVKLEIHSRSVKVHEANSATDLQAAVSQFKEFYDRCQNVFSYVETEYRQPIQEEINLAFTSATDAVVKLLAEVPGLAERDDFARAENKFCHAVSISEHLRDKDNDELQQHLCKARNSITARHEFVRSQYHDDCQVLWCTSDAHDFQSFARECGVVDGVFLVICSGPTPPMPAPKPTRAPSQRVAQNGIRGRGNTHQQSAGYTPALKKGYGNLDVSKRATQAKVQFVAYIKLSAASISWFPASENAGIQAWFRKLASECDKGNAVMLKGEMLCEIQELTQLQHTTVNFDCLMKQPPQEFLQRIDDAVDQVRDSQINDDVGIADMYLELSSEIKKGILDSLTGYSLCAAKLTPTEARAQLDALKQITKHLPADVRRNIETVLRSDDCEGHISKVAQQQQAELNNIYMSTIHEQFRSMELALDRNDYVLTCAIQHRLDASIRNNVVRLQGELDGGNAFAVLTQMGEVYKTWSAHFQFGVKYQQRVNQSWFRWGRPASLSFTSREPLERLLQSMAAQIQQAGKLVGARSLREADVVKQALQVSVQFLCQEKSALTLYQELLGRRKTLQHEVSKALERLASKVSGIQKQFREAVKAVDMLPVPKLMDWSKDYADVILVALSLEEGCNLPVFSELMRGCVSYSDMRRKLTESVAQWSQDTLPAL